MRQEDRLNMKGFGWANNMLNMVFVAGRLRLNKDNPQVFLLQQTPAVEQSIAVVTRFPLGDSFPDGSYVSVFARLRGRTRIDENSQPLESGVVLQALHTRFVNGLEIDPDAAQERLMRALKGIPKDAAIDTGIKPMDVETPPELAGLVADETQVSEERSPGDSNYEAMTKDNRLIRNGNRAIIAGVIGFMEYRDGGVDRSKSRVQLYVQQTPSLEDAVLVRVYGKQAELVAANYRPGHAIYASGTIQMDVKRDTQGDGQLRITPYLKTSSIEIAQTPAHIKINPYPEWAINIYKDAETATGLAKRQRYIEVVKESAKATPATSTEPVQQP